MSGNIGTYFCYRCNRLVSGQLTASGVVCQVCQDGFIEQHNGPPDNANNPQQQPPGQASIADILRHIVPGMANAGAFVPPPVQPNPGPDPYAQGPRPNFAFPGQPIFRTAPSVTIRTHVYRPYARPTRGQTPGNEPSGMPNIYPNLNPGPQAGQQQVPPRPHIRFHFGMNPNAPYHMQNGGPVRFPGQPETGQPNPGANVPQGHTANMPNHGANLPQGPPANTPNQPGHAPLRFHVGFHQHPPFAFPPGQQPQPNQQHPPQQQFVFHIRHQHPAQQPNSNPNPEPGQQGATQSGQQDNQQPSQQAPNQHANQPGNENANQPGQNPFGAVLEGLNLNQFFNMIAGEIRNQNVPAPPATVNVAGGEEQHPGPEGGQQPAPEGEQQQQQANPQQGQFNGFFGMIQQFLRSMAPGQHGNNEQQPHPEGAAVPPQPGPQQGFVAFLESLAPPNAQIHFEIDGTDFINLNDAEGGNVADIMNQLMARLSGEPVQVGISAQDQTRLPMAKVSQKHCDNETQCVTCMETFKLDEDVVELGCRHIFHKPCLLPWLQGHRTCPICRTEIDPSTWPPNEQDEANRQPTQPFVDNDDLD